MSEKIYIVTQGEYSDYRILREYTKVTTAPDMDKWGKFPWQHCATADSTVSAEHAKKLAVEARQAWIVRNPQ